MKSLDVLPMPQQPGKETVRRDGVLTSCSSSGLQHRATKRLETSAARCLRKGGRRRQWTAAAALGGKPCAPWRRQQPAHALSTRLSSPLAAPLLDGQEPQAVQQHGVGQVGNRGCCYVLGAAWARLQGAIGAGRERGWLPGAPGGTAGPWERCDRVLWALQSTAHREGRAAPAPAAGAAAGQGAGAACGLLLCPTHHRDLVFQGIMSPAHRVCAERRKCHAATGLLPLALPAQPATSFAPDVRPARRPRQPACERWLLWR